jgi:hypothetical protein
MRGSVIMFGGMRLLLTLLVFASSLAAQPGLHVETPMAPYRSVMSIRLLLIARLVLIPSLACADGVA